ncbi:MAG: molecular chaperone DnaJ [Pseudomonadota bacterium]
MSQKKDYYQILGVSRSATQDEIKKAYRKLAMENHPDKHSENKAHYEKKFKEINEAYSTLSDQNKKAHYDQFGTADGFGQGGGFSGFSGGNSGGFDFNIHDIFDNFFGQGAGAGRASQKKTTRQSRGSDLRYKLDITLEEAFNGAKKTIEFSALDKCDVCNGFGSASGKKEETTCSDCNGHGVVRMQQGFFIMEQTCRRCEGSGTTIKNPCKNCNGTGLKTKTKKVIVDIPAGVNANASVKVQGAGEAGQLGGGYGDLYVVMNIKPHKLFERSGDNLHCIIPITFTKAALGGEIVLAGIDKKKITFDIPKGIQYGQQIQVKNEGMSVMNRSGKRGDLIVTVHIETPVKLSTEQESLLRQFEETIHSNSNPKSNSFFDTIKDFFS